MPETSGKSEEWIGNSLQVEPQHNRSLAYHAGYEVIQTSVGVLVACLNRDNDSGVVSLDGGAEAGGMFGELMLKPFRLEKFVFFGLGPRSKYHS